MERKITKLLVSTGIVMAAAVSMIPLTSYAAVIPNVAGHGIYNCGGPDNPCASSADSEYTYTDEEGNVITLPSEAGVSVKIDSILSLDAASTKMEGVIPAYPDMIKNNFLDVKVRSAKEYTISISAEDPLLTMEGNEVMIIRPKSGIEAAGTYGWGIKKKISQDADANTYSAVSSNSETFFTGQPTDTISSHDEQNFVTTKFDVGVRASEQNLQGTYSTDITVIAAVKN